MERPTNDLILSGVGLTRSEFAAAVFPSLPEEYHDEMDGLVWHWERELVTKGKGSLFPGALDALDELTASGRALAVATNAGTGYMNHILDYFDIRDRFADVRCAGAENTNDKSELIGLLLKNLSLDAGRSVMVGDRRSDVDAGRRAGTRAIGCTWGFASRGELADADSIIDRFEELPGAVESLD